MEGFVTLLFCQGRRVKFGRLGYFDVYFSKKYLFLKFKASMTSLCILRRPYNFAIFNCRRPNLVT